MRVPVLLLAGAALLSSCCGGGEPPLPTYPKDLSGPAILEALRARQARVATLVAEGKGSLSGSEGADGSFRWQCWAAGTSRMRLVLTHRLKGCLADAVVDGDRVACYDPESKTVARGRLGSLGGLGLRQTVSLLRLLAGPADGLAFDTLPRTDEALRLVLDLGGGRKWRLRLDRRHLVYEEGELWIQGAVRARLAFDPEGYRLEGGIPWPMEMTVDQPGEAWKLKLKFQDLKVGVPIDPEVFQLKVPEGMKEELLD